MIFYVCCMNRCIYIGIFYFLFAGGTSAGDFRYLLTEDGLPDGEINSIVQDSAGNMWFATWSGLVKYDGYKFELFRPELGNPMSLPEKKIKQLFVDSSDNLWIATSMNLCRYNKSNNTFHTYHFNDLSSRGINISYLNEVEKHLIIHAVEGIFLMPLSQASNPQYGLSRLQVADSNEPVNLYYNFSMGTGKSFILAANEETKSNILFTTLKYVNEKSSLEIDTIIELNEIVNDIEYVASENTYYIATPNGLIMYAPGKGGFVKKRYFQNQAIRNLHYTSNNRIYITLYEPKLLYLDLHTGLTGAYLSNPNLIGSLLDNEIHTLCEDFSGNLWIGHQGQGISILNLYQKKFYSFLRDPFKENSLNSNTVMCFEGTENEIIIGCRSNGLNIVSKKQTQGNNINYQRIPIVSEYASGTYNDGIWDIARQSDSLFWVGTEMGLFRLQKTKAGWEINPFKGKPAINYSIRKIFVDSNNNIWCGSHGFGLLFIPNLNHNTEGINYQYEPVAENPSTLSDGVVIDIFLDSKKHFWIGTNKGFNRLTVDYESLDLSGKSKPELKFKRYVATQPLEGYLNNNEINCFYENYDGNLWIATQGGGINILNPMTEEFSHLTTVDGLPSNDVISMVPDDDGNLWISTNKGLVRFNRFGKDPLLSVFGPSDGVQGEIFMINSSYKSADDQLFFGGDKGFTTFYPRDIKLNEIKPRISFTNLKIKNNLVNPGDTLYKSNILKAVINETSDIALPYNSNVFSIGTSVLHFQNPESNSIVYKLEGIHKNWITIPASYGNIYLSNIPAGKYTLFAKALSSDGIYSDEIKKLDIEINPPWYGKGFFISIYILIFILGSYGIIYFIISRQKLIYQKKLDKIDNENNEQKMLFLTNIAHELRTPMSLIIAPVEDMVQNVPEDNPWKEHLKLISRNSKFLLRLINQIIDFRKLNAGKIIFQPQKADIAKVVKNVVLNFKGLESSRNIDLQLQLPAESIIGVIDVQKFEEVLYNLISNAFKNTSDNHSIIVSLELNQQEEQKEQKNIKLTVFNEGKEINEENKKRIFERFYKVDESTEGAGIGLSFSKSLVEMHNGTISVESIAGKGVAFHVLIPAGEVEIKNESAEIIVDKTESGHASDSEVAVIQPNGQESVLIVEDNSELREFLVKIFSRHYKCYAADNGADAWELVLKKTPSVIISDIVMPRLDGLLLCKKVKENTKTCHIPVMLLTAKDAPGQIAEGFSVGADSYVVKPFDVELLTSQTARLIQNRELIREKYRTQNFMVEIQKDNSSRDEEFLETVRKILEENISDPELNVNSLSKQLNISTTQLYRKLKELTGHSPVDFIRTVKLQKAYGLLSIRSNTVKEVCYLTGFNNMSYFIKCFRKQFGVTPAHFRDYGKDEKTKEKIKNVQI
jgi:signal transduction histidine kinase/ligand-binding sensor domain-containing protein/DNA-binding response OmpR family regulator